MNENGVKITEEMAKSDEKELTHYGFCSTLFYVDYRKLVDTRLKALMVELAHYYEATNLKTEEVNQMLYEQYEAFWIRAEPKLQLFYEDVREILKLPCEVPESLSPQEALHNEEEDMLRTELEALKEQYHAKKCFLDELRRRKEVLDKIWKPFKEMVEQKMKIKKAHETRLIKLENCDQERQEIADKFMEKIEKKDLMGFIASQAKPDQEKIVEFMKKVSIEIMESDN